MIIEDKLRDIQSHAAEIADQMNSGTVTGAELTRLSKEYSQLSEILPLVDEYFQIKRGIDDANEMLHDAELKSIAAQQLNDLNHALPEIEKKLQIALLPRDEADDNSVIMEIRAGVGGEESALFAGDLYNQYKSYALRHGWKVEVIEEAATSLHGYKEVIFKVDGVGAYARLKFESGIHRVQRVPETEASGRIHTSAASVAVMPEAKDIDVVIDDKDIRIDVFRASGAGGQHVNKTDSAVRITHLPTGIVVTCQNERSQIQNREMAMKMLRSKLYELELQKRAEAENAALAAQKKIEWGSQIRNYVLYPYQLVKDVRTGVEKTDSAAVLDGDLDDFMLACLQRG